jgi:hypothetical protein
VPRQGEPACVLAECACRPICAEDAPTTTWQGCSNSLCVLAVLCGAGGGRGAKCAVASDGRARGTNRAADAAAQRAR